MKLMNIIYTNKMAESVIFYEAIGLTPVSPGEINQWWNVLTLGDAEVALHWNADNPIPKPSSHLELHFTMPNSDLDRYYAAFKEKGLPLGGPVETLEGVGRFFWLTDPEGLKVHFDGIQEPG